MQEFKIFRSERFNELLLQFPNNFVDRVVKIEEQLKVNPFVGKPLDYKWFREKKIGKYRVYYLIYENLSAVYLVVISDKKTQQKIIDQTKLLFAKYKEDIGKLV